jgi:mRNA-degrading endonuclease YafQ of YafQ-DinJ toxin-antitoxin module
LDKYWDKLFADPIEVETSSGKISIQPQRTNNIMEHFFRDFKRNNIRKTGNHSIGKSIRAMIADTPLVKNLKNPNYIKIILGEKKTLEEVFALIESAEVRQILKKSRITDDKIPKKIKELIDKNDLPERILNSFKKCMNI